VAKDFEDPLVPPKKRWTKEKYPLALRISIGLNTEIFVASILEQQLV
jgi:hypothetical protein